MANQNVITHVFGGAVALADNQFPSTASVDVTAGGFAPTFTAIPGTANTTIASNQGTTFYVEQLTAARTITLPSPSVAMEGRIYTFYVLTPGAFAATFQTTGAVPIPGGAAASTATTASKAAIVTIIYVNSTTVVGSVVIGA